ncbi:MAG: hypothetical protein WBD22_12165 [Pyrinomonadaceae bacterium]
MEVSTNGTECRGEKGVDLPDGERIQRLFGERSTKGKEVLWRDLGLDVIEQPEGLVMNLRGGGRVFIYSKPDHKAATYTILNFPIENIDEAVENLGELGITLEKFGGESATDKKGIFRGVERNLGPNIAWFRDPAGNFLSVLEEK